MLNPDDSRKIALALYDSELNPLDLLDIRDDILKAENNGATSIQDLPMDLRAALHLNQD